MASILKTEGACIDTSLRKLGEIILTVAVQGDGTGFLTLSLEKAAAVTLTFLSNSGAFYDAVNGNSLGQTVTTASSGTANVYLKVSADTKLKISKASNVYAFGDSTRSSSTNSPYFKIELAQAAQFTQIYRMLFTASVASGDIAYLKSLSNLMTVSIPDIAAYTSVSLPASDVTGNITDLPNKSTIVFLNFYGTKVAFDFANISQFALLNTLNMYGVNFTNIDLLYMAQHPALYYLNADRQATGITYTGTTTSFNGKTLREIYVQGCTLSTTQIDNLLIAVSTATWAGNKKLYLKGTKSSASDAAVTTLKAAGVTVNINGVTL